MAILAARLTHALQNFQGFPTLSAILAWQPAKAKLDICRYFRKALAKLVLAPDPGM